MAKYCNRARETAERLVILRDYLYATASPIHAIKMTDILAYLEAVGHKAEIKTVYSDLKTLKYFLNVETKYDGRQRGYLLLNPPFQPYELRSIVNSIQAAKFITQQEADELTQKIMKLADEHTRPSLNRQTYIRNRARTVNEDAMKGLDTIYEAIAKNRKISYKYFEYALNEHRSKNYRDMNKSKIITASPYAVLWEDEFIVFAVMKITEEEEEQEAGAYIELKYMEQIKILDEEREGKEIAQKSLKHENDILTKQSLEKTKLKVSKMYVTDVVDKFGDDVIMTPIDDEFFIATIDGVPTPELYMWTRTFFPCLEIVYPPDKEAKLKRYFADISEGKYVSPSTIYEFNYL